MGFFIACYEQIPNSNPNTRSHHLHSYHCKHLEALVSWSKESRHKRGYGSIWDKTRKQILERDNYLCHCDQCQGGKLRVTPASEVDHITPKAQGGTDEHSNLRAINSQCHKRVTLEQQGKTYIPRKTVGIDGWPI